MTEQYGNVTVMGIEFTNTTLEGFVDSTIRPCLEQDGKCFIVTANPEIVIAARDHPDFMETVQSADHVLPDGIGIINAAKMMGTPLQERVSGIDVMREMLAHAEEKGYSAYFLGAKEEANRKAVERAKRRFPKLQIAGRHHGYADLDDEAFVEDIAATKPDIIFVALGMMKQEQWIRRHMDRFDSGVFMGVGGSFDVLSGEAKRAPDIWIRFQLEWLYRLLKQPKRIFRVLKVAQFMMLHVPVINRIMRIFGYTKTKARGKG
ncbi:WecB/TagA/CpsF family glycosyltransferase [Salinicoccus luteus]|uniref:WecB/TagA/CpsF family glycosyltransferase n=1 Tax=Salinicoccus luteus TaxID=367840 RepID=UPI0004E26538|nr:WecB/TagA/CpsF family glycosyltransferase [Salinicoccus luteus]